jgi:hypothetical protein
MNEKRDTKVDTNFNRIQKRSRHILEYLQRKFEDPLEAYFCIKSIETCLANWIEHQGVPNLREETQPILTELEKDLEEIWKEEEEEEEEEEDKSVRLPDKKKQPQM